uniref:Reverse transcriptase Ty1/copia-type domain-containing protein n=1 Tax=Fagus sylvatica TaxID=28930 RepID=A0A2N9FVX7_FAGSY
MNFAYQGKNPTTKLAAMASASNLHYTQNAETWLTDTGATDHITANANNLNPQAPYQGQEQVSVGNGQNLPIQNIDNNCSCYFDAKKLLIQDLPSGKLLYKGLSSNGVYPIQSHLFHSTANKTACVAHSISSDKWHLWHSRLGHPSSNVLHNIFPSFSTGSSSNTVIEHCQHCLAGKMHQLPFPTSNKIVSSPFELIHADLWGPAPVIASNAFRFYLVFVDEFTKFTWTLLHHFLPRFQTLLHHTSIPQTTHTPTSNTISLPTGLIDLSSHSPAPIIMPTASLDSPTAATSAMPTTSTPISTPNTALPASSPLNSLPHTAAAPISTNISLPNPLSHPMQTRSKKPPSYTMASKHSKWCIAMDEEFQALQQQATWSLVPLPASKNVVGCKWVYKLKHHSDGSIARYKARLVAKGFHQQYGVDFYETFSPVIKPPTVRLILSLAVSLHWPLRQLDVKNAFLHGTLKEEVYMTQPQGYIDSTHPSYVCKLQKSIYGLKQAPRACNTPTFLDHLIQQLNSVFDLKDLGSLHYFLGLQITRTSSRLYLNQSKYAQDLLKKHNMLDCQTSPLLCIKFVNICLPQPLFTLLQPKEFLDTFGAPSTMALNSRLVHFIYQLTQMLIGQGTLMIAGPTSGFLVYLGNNAVTWSAKKQPTVSRSSTESEYRALAIASAELCWLLLRTRSSMLEPNTFEVDFHFVRERVLRKDLVVKFVSTVDQLADIFTKSLPTHRFLDLRHNLTVPVPKIEGG